MYTVYRENGIYAVAKKGDIYLSLFDGELVASGDNVEFYGVNHNNEPDSDNLTVVRDGEVKTERMY